MTLYRTIDTSTDIEPIEADITTYTSNVVALHTSSAAHFLTYEEAAGHKKAQLQALADTAAALATQAASDVADFDKVMTGEVSPAALRVK